MLHQKHDTAHDLLDSTELDLELQPLEAVPPTRIRTTAYYHLLLGSTLTWQQVEQEIERHAEYPPAFFAEYGHAPSYTGRAVLVWLGYADRRNSVWDATPRY